jgi:acyl-CoA synthetase (AMP-forming)/AMP-acid ligase II
MNSRGPDSVQTLVDLLRWRVTERGAQLAYTFLADGEGEEVPLTYRELDLRARAVGAQLQRMGVQGERAILLYEAGLDYIVAFFGCLYAGAVAVPAYPPDLLRPDRTLPRILAIINDARPAAVLTTSAGLALARRLFDRFPALGKLQWVTTDNLGRELAAESRCFEVGELAQAWRDPALSGDALAFLQYTSGSTATPKGVMVSHSSILYNEKMLQAAFGATAQSTFVMWLPLYHDMGLIGNVLQALYLGSHCVLMSPLHFLQRPMRWLQAISRYRAYVSGGPNFAYDLCVRKITPEQRSRLDLSSWTIAFNGAEPVRAGTLQRFAETFAPCGFRREILYPCYGLAEATLFVTGGLPKEPPVLYAVDVDALAQDRVAPAAPPQDAGSTSRVLVGCGRTWIDQKILIVDPESSRPCPADRVGEIWVSGPNVADGYWQHSEETQQTFGARLADSGEEPFLRTGDLGFMKDGELFIAGRLKDLIIIDGLNHYPQDIELTVEQSHPALRPGCCAAFSVEINGQEQLVVVAELARDDRQSPGTLGRNPATLGLAALDGGAAMGFSRDEVISAIRRALLAQHELRVYDVVLLKAGAIAKTSSGKIQRRASRAEYLAGKLAVWTPE